MEAYLLDLRTLLQILVRQKQSGMLYAEDLRLPGSRRTLQARLELLQGKIQSCVLRAQGEATSVAEGSTALQVLYELGTLEWFWTPSFSSSAAEDEFAAFSTTSSPARSPFINSESLLPRRTARADSTMLASLSRIHRRVLAMVDGERSVSKIASVLAMTDQQGLLRVLNELHAWGLIVWETSP